MKNNRKFCYNYLKIRGRLWKRLFSRAGKHSTGDAKKGQVFNAFFLSFATKMAADTTTTIDKGKKEMAEIRNEEYLGNF